MDVVIEQLLEKNALLECVYFKNRKKVILHIVVD